MRLLSRVRRTRRTAEQRRSVFRAATRVVETDSTGEEQFPRSVVVADVTRMSLSWARRARPRGCYKEVARVVEDVTEMLEGNCSRGIWA